MFAKIQQYNDLKGFGFLLKDFRTRVFFHVKDWKGSVPPQQGMQVSYELGPAFKPGLPDSAVSVTPLAGEEQKFVVSDALTVAASMVKP